MSTPGANDLATVDPAIIAAVRASLLQELSAAVAAADDQAIAADYRAWWLGSWGVPPNNQAVAVAVAWGRQLLGLWLSRASEDG